MDRQALERLLTDHALGELDADVEQLLLGYLATDPAAAELAREYQDVTGLARQALAAGPAAKLPPFPAERLREAQRPRPKRLAWPGRVRGVLALAASVLLGLGAGWMWFRQAAPAPVGGKPEVIVKVIERTIRVPERVPDAAKATPGDSAFWSVGSLAKHAAPRRRGDAARLLWSSPVEMPTIGGGL